MTHSGLKQFDMTAYSLTHGLEIVNKVLDSRPKIEEADEEESDS